MIENNAPSAEQVANVATGVIGGVFGVFGTIFYLLLMVLISIYLLLEREKITHALLHTVPDPVRDQSLELFYAVERSLVKYLRGQLLLCAIMGVLGVGHSVPHRRRVRPRGGGMGCSHGDHPRTRGLPGRQHRVSPSRCSSPRAGFFQALLVAGLFLIAQQIEGNLLVPRIQGGSVGVHPLIAALRHAGRDGTLRDNWRYLRRPRGRHRGRDDTLPARDPALRSLGQAGRQARRGRAGKTGKDTPSIPAGTASTDDGGEEER